MKDCWRIDSMCTHSYPSGNELSRFWNEECRPALIVKSPFPGFDVEVAIEALELGLKTRDRLWSGLFINYLEINGITCPPNV
jgi:hypothetical protein